MTDLMYPQDIVRRFELKWAMRSASSITSDRSAQAINKGAEPSVREDRKTERTGRPKSSVPKTRLGEQTRLLGPEGDALRVSR